MKALRSDNGGKYISKAFREFCISKGIHRELMVLYNPQQNDVAECLNQQIQEKVWSMLSNAHLPNDFGLRHLTLKFMS